MSREPAPSSSSASSDLSATPQEPAESRSASLDQRPDPNGRSPSFGQTEGASPPERTPTAPANFSSVTQPIKGSPQGSPGDSNRPSGAMLLLVSLGLMGLGFLTNLYWLGLISSLVALLLSARIFWAAVAPLVAELITPAQVRLTLAIVGGLTALVGFFQLTGINRRLGQWLTVESWDGVGAIGDLVGAVGQILIAILAVYIAWRQYVISKDLTIQQNLITQQQTIDSYFQGISDLVLDAEGLLEDWPQERAIAEGRTSAILGSVDPLGKAKIVRFLSRSRLLTPLKRDRHLGRAMLDGMGGYQEDRDFGIRVIDLGVMLAAANLAQTDLRWTDLSDTNLVRSNLEGCDLVKANLARAILYEANLRSTDLMGARLFYGSPDTASPRTRTDVPDYQTGTCTGAVVENADFTGAQRLSEQQRYYICSWGGERTRSTVPGGCEGIPNKLGR
ncbi:MAG: pentapeptide repeat-containing protein [Leptolyngbyaceae bacterium]|nr:pentapeptide repeat-containing protein [Leptolyngbyaceae bacterium]